jgi:hypothetical protein
MDTGVSEDPSTYIFRRFLQNVGIKIIIFWDVTSGSLVDG